MHNLPHARDVSCTINYVQSTLNNQLCSLGQKPSNYPQATVFFANFIKFQDLIIIP